MSAQLGIEGSTIAIAFPFIEAHRERLRAAVAPGFQLVFSEGRDQAAVDEFVGPGTVGLIAQLRPSDATRAPDLRWHQALSAGVEHLLTREPWPIAVTLTNARGVYAVSIGQYVLAAILRVAEQVDARREMQLAGRWLASEADYCGRPVRGRTLAVVGYGGIGREIARLAAAVGMRVVAVTARPERRIDDAYRMAGTGDPDGTIPDAIVGLDRLAETIAHADFVAVTLPLTPSSRGLIDRVALSALRPDAWIINTGRGAVIDEAALIELLRAGRIGGAVLDVFEQEPLPSQSPLWRLPNVVITPHISGADAPEALTELVEANVGRFTTGRPLLNVVDLERGY